jgi:adenylate cyclase
LPKHEHVERKLAAILAADVVGYSRLMGADEVGTLRALKAVRKEHVDPSIAAHGGRIVKTTGDGLLVDFPSVVDAVACAFTIQRKMIGRNTNVSEEKRIVFRVGINIGDIIIDGKDIFGDGVNIAARLESICEPGGLCISDTACDQVRDKLPLTFADRGEQQVKNIARPVRVFGLAPQAIAEAPELSLGRATPAKPRNRAILAAVLALVMVFAGAAAWWTMREGASPASQMTSAPVSSGTDVRPSIAVLPLTSLADVAKGDYFADGLTEDIISALGRFSEFVVRSRNAVFSYKGKTPRPEEVGRELNVRYIVEGSIRRSPERIRISIRLTDAMPGALLWSEQYDVEPKDIFTVQDEITRRIAGTLATRLSNLELAKAATKPPSSLEAYDFVLRGRDLFTRVNRSANSQARALFERAIELDPTYAPSYVGLGRVELNGVTEGWTSDPEAALQRAENLGQKAIAIDSTSAGAHALLGRTYIRYADYDRALDEMRRAVELNTSDPDAYAGLATALLWAGDLDASVKAFETASQFRPNLTVTDSFTLGLAYLLAGRNADAIRTLERSLERNKTHVYTNAILAAAYAQAGRQADASRQVETVRKLSPRFSSAEFGSLLRSPQLRAKLGGAMQKSGL